MESDLSDLFYRSWKTLFSFSSSPRCIESSVVETVVLCWAAIYTEHIFTYLYISVTGISPDDLVFAER